jgi:regulator of protease activity HflC (stomatin/prohibitin superfamily)
MDALLTAMAVLGSIGLGLYALAGVRQVNQWQEGLKFTFGRFTGVVKPGLRFILPGIQRLVRIDTRIANRDLPRQSVITADNVTATIDAVVYYRVVDPAKATLNVQDYELAVKDRAKVVLRDMVGEITLDELLTNRDEVASKVRSAVEQFVSQWGLHIELIALQDILLPENIQEAIARKAIAERDKQVVITKSQADAESAKNFAEAARVLAASPGALELRRLEALAGITSKGTSKVIFDLARPSDTRTQALAAAEAVGGGVRLEPEQEEEVEAGAPGGTRAKRG